MRPTKYNIGVWSLFKRDALIMLLLLSYVAVFLFLNHAAHQAPADGDFVVVTVNTNTNTNTHTNSKLVFPKSPVENNFTDLLPGYHYTRR
jgi:hypothetical protein